jgi:AraC-like DNA-binding protein
MAAETKLIPIHRLEQETDQGYVLERVSAMGGKTEQAVLLDVHRDDHYIFLLQETGKSRAMVDFQLSTLGNNSLFFVLPGQPHHYLNADKKISGWFLAMAPGFIPNSYRAVLEDPLLLQKPLSVGVKGMKPLAECLQLAAHLQQQPTALYTPQVIYSLLSSFTGMVTNLYVQQDGAMADKKPRKRTIALEFRKLVNERYKILKSPGEYAAALHLSLSYLNEAVKETTGSSVSYWIHQEIMLEAKRLLYYSQCNVKEIAYELGYEDHTYFSRLFKKTTGRTPGEFRQSYRR